MESLGKGCKIEREIQKAKNLIHSSKCNEGKLKSHWLKARKYKEELFNTIVHLTRMRKETNDAVVESLLYDDEAQQFVA